MSAKPGFSLDQNGHFVIENYHQARPFANFFPGIAGMWGIPMWVFTTNRGQGIASFGIESKDKAIVEFQPANKAYRLTATHGYRTFLKLTRQGATRFYEPFRSPAGQPFKIQQTMRVSSHDLTLEEVNTTLGLKITVNYFTVPEESFAALARTVQVENIGKGALDLEMIDGLSAIIPYGQNDWVMKNMCRTIEAWYKVRNLARKAPYFQLNVEAADTPQVKHIKGGNFYFAFDPKAAPGTLLAPIVETAVVFGQASDLMLPEAFMAPDFRVPQDQQTDNRTPSAMSHARGVLKAGAVKTVISLTGFARGVDELNATVKKATSRGFVAARAARNRQIIDEIKAMALTNSSSREFNAYAGQTFLDNVMRGGLPISLKTAEGPVVLNVYSRKHGDLERDYNFFRLSPTFLSQGNGNYRDVNQNRRNDVWFNPDLKESAVVNFFSLTQADGYNPLVVCGMSFAADNGPAVESLLKRFVIAGDQDALKAFLSKGFMPGDLFTFLTDQGIRLKGSPRHFLSAILGICQKFETAQHGEGFWTDHWTYNIDLAESYLALYPENLRRLLLELREFTFFHNAVYVRPRDERYVLTPRGVRQYDSLHEGREDKDRGHKLRVRHGQGEVYRTNLLVKLLCLVANRTATLDPSGIGIDMEANKPNWYDSLNGLPGLLGSSLSETFELKRFSLFVLEALEKLAVDGTETVPVFEELAVFVDALKDILGEKLSGLDYWKRANTVKEEYREKVRAGVTGVEKEVALGDIRSFLEAVVVKVNAGVDRARRPDGLFATYFYHKVTRYEPVTGVPEAKEGPRVRPLDFERHDMPIFLEGFVHALRSEQDPARALDLHRRVSKSALYDRALGMYRLNADITGETEEIGRTRVFPRGWLENESIWLHMEYKYFLELLRRGLTAEYYECLKTCCIPFLPPERYGRSILENSSFIVSSAHPDARLHGQGCVARLSGSTAEFIHMWMFMNAGPAPFVVDSKGALVLALRPALEGKWFATEKSRVVWSREGVEKSVDLPADTYAFMFMGRTLVVYHNPARANTFGPGKAGLSRHVLHYAGARKAVTVDGAVLSGALARDVRDGRVVRIDAWLGQGAA